MKKNSLIFALVIMALGVSGVLASEPPKDVKPTKAATRKQDKKAKAARETRQVAITGSYIKRDVKRDGVITDGPNAVYVIDMETIQRSGGADLTQALIRSGFRR